MPEYSCARCGNKYSRAQKLPDDIEPRCETCRAEIRKAAKRATWHAHKTDYLAKKKKQPELRENIPSDVSAMQAIPVPMPENFVRETHLGQPTNLRLLDGRKVVWMGRWLTD